MRPADVGSAVPLGVWSMLSPSFEQCTEVLGLDEISRMRTDRMCRVPDHVPFGPAMVQYAQPFFFNAVLLILAVS